VKRLSYDIVIVGSGAGGGTMAQELSPLCRSKGWKIAVLEKGPKLRDDEFTGREIEMSAALYEENGGFLTAERTMTLAFGRAYGGSTVVYTGTSLPPPQRVIERWNVPGLETEDLHRRVAKFSAENNVHFLPEEEINENNRLFVAGCRRLGYRVEQFPVNVKGCLGSSLCNLGCPNQAKQGTNRVQLPRAESNGVEVVTRCEVESIGERTLRARVTAAQPGEKGEPSAWEPGEYQIDARIIVVCAGAVNSPALLLRSGLGSRLPRLGHGFTVHPALILVAEHERPIENFVGHPKSFYLDQFAEDERFVLETCMYFPFTTAKSLAGFGESHSSFMKAFPRLQMVLLLACDKATAGNRVTTDAEGRPVVHYRFTPEVVRALVRGGITSARIFFAAGAKRVHLPFVRPSAVEASEADRLDEIERRANFLPGGMAVSAAHLQGGCGMGRAPSDSVTDAWGRVHGTDWLYVADASLFPDSVEINPYLTIMALADRVAERIREVTATA
jgi:choline dehydrogenase-like flavoprotein